MIQYIRVDKREKEVSVTIARCKPNHESDIVVASTSQEEKTRGDLFSKHFLSQVKVLLPGERQF